MSALLLCVWCLCEWVSDCEAGYLNTLCAISVRTDYSLRKPHRKAEEVKAGVLGVGARQKTSGAVTVTLSLTDTLVG